MIHQQEIRHGHLFCGLGGGARGFNRGEARVGNLMARFRCLGGIDVDAASVRDFERLAGVPGTLLDLFDRDQYVAFHGREPPAGWRETAPDDIRIAFGNAHPHILFLSAPCKGFSGLLSETASRSGKYQALNRLTLRGVWLALEAYKDDPVELIVFENVPRIATRGRPLLDRIVALLRGYGYAVAETTHDCGELGNLAQSRKRFLLVARHAERVPPFLYEPVKRPLRGVGEVLDRLPPPLDGHGIAMHRMPALQWKTWVRLAFVKAGSDWRSLNDLRVNDGVLTDYGIAADAGWHGNVMGVTAWGEPSGTVTGSGRVTTGRFAVADPRVHADYNGDVLGVRQWGEPTGTVPGRSYPNCGAHSVADPRIDGHPKSVQLGVREWDQPAGVVTGKMFAGGGPNAVADPRLQGSPRFNNTFRIVPWAAPSPAVAGPGGPAGGLAVADPRAVRGYEGKGKYRVTDYGEAAGTVIGASTTGNGAFAVADPRYGWQSAHENKMAVRGWDEPAKTVTGSDRVGSGAQSVADPRWRDGSERYLTQGHYGVIPYDAPSGGVTASGQHDNGRWSVADPRPARNETQSTGFPETPSQINPLPIADARLVCVIRALDGTWHRPFTTFELAALQGLVDPGETLELDGLSDSAWRERIGNAVPPPAAQAVAGVMGRTLLLAWSGETFMLSAEPIWVQPIAVALMAAQIPAAE